MQIVQAIDTFVFVKTIQPNVRNDALTFLSLVLDMISQRV